MGVSQVECKRLHRISLAMAAAIAGLTISGTARAQFGEISGTLSVSERKVLDNANQQVTFTYDIHSPDRNVHFINFTVEGLADVSWGCLAPSGKIAGRSVMMTGQYMQFGDVSYPLALNASTGQMTAHGSGIIIVQPAMDGRPTIACSTSHQIKVAAISYRKMQLLALSPFGRVGGISPLIAPIPSISRTFYPALLK